MRIWLLLVLMLGCRREAAPVREPPREVDVQLPEASSLTLLALWPRAGEPTDPGRFLGHPILASVPVVDAALRSRLLARVRTSIVGGEESALCFWPRHGLRLESGGEIIEVLICFECSAVEVHRRGAVWRAPTSSSAQPLLDEVLAQAGFVRPPEPSPSKALFVEDARLDQLRPGQEFLRAKETWSSMNREFQHCIEWELAGAQAAAARSQLNPRLRKLSLPRLDPSGSSAGAGVRVGFYPTWTEGEGPRRDSNGLLIVCSVRETDGGRMRPFVDEVRWDPKAPQLPPELNALPAETARITVDRGGTREIELMLITSDGESVARALLRGGFAEGEPIRGARSFVRGASRAELAVDRLRVYRD